MNLLIDGLLLMLVGMGTVSIFLVVMVVWIEFSSKFLSKLSHLLPAEAPAPPKRRPAPKAAAESEGDLIAVISAAVHRYRSEHKQ